jgi:electron transport complex protein RnfB
MEKEDKVYVDLQKHLDRQAVGFPATPSGAGIRILKHIFSPKEADIATCLTYKPESIETIYSRAKRLVGSTVKLSKILSVMEKNGGVESKVTDDIKYYCTAPLIVGMYEYQRDRLTPEFIKDFDTYTAERKFGVSFLSTELPQMRTIPIGKSIPIQGNVSTFDEVSELVRASDGSFAIFECICRKKRGLMEKTCKVTDRKETCLAVGDFAKTAIRLGNGRSIEMEEALSILEKNVKEGMVLQPSNTEKADFICSCCGCCCGMLRMQQFLPKPLDYWASNFYASIDTDTCEGCGKCRKKCQVGAIKMAEKKQPPVIDRNRCIGCGLCVVACPTEAMALQKKVKETRPPETREELYDIIMAKKKGTLGQLKITGKLIKDAVITGQTHLLK